MPPKKKGSKKKQKEAEQTCSEEHGDVVDNLEQQAQEECTEPLQKKRRQNLNFTDEQEEELVDWLKGHPIFYNRGSKEYKDAQKKQRLLEEKAHEIDAPGKNLIAN
jgi:hypothetical protein